MTHPAPIEAGTPMGRVREILDQEGPRGLLLRTLGATVYRRLMFFTRDLHESPPEETELEFEIGLLEFGQLEEYLALRPDVPAAELERRLASGQRCVTIRTGGSLAAVRWMSLGFAEVPYFGLSFELGESLAYIYDVYADPAYRGRRLGSAGGPDFYRQLLAGSGVTTLLGTLWHHNPSGLRFLRAAGMHPIGTVGCLRLGSHRVPVKRIPEGHLGRVRRFRPAR